MSNARARHGVNFAIDLFMLDLAVFFKSEIILHGKPTGLALGRHESSSRLMTFPQVLKHNPPNRQILQIAAPSAHFLGQTDITHCIRLQTKQFRRRSIRRHQIG